MKFPRLHIIAKSVIEFDLLKFMDAVPQDQNYFSYLDRSPEPQPRFHPTVRPFDKKPELLTQFQKEWYSVIPLPQSNEPVQIAGLKVHRINK